MATASKLRSASQLVFCSTAEVAKEEEVTISVWPSAGACATAVAPIDPLAPPRFSTTKGWPKRDCRRSASGRAMTSFDPPGGKGTTTRTGRVGQTACARAMAGAASVPPSSRRRAIMVASLFGRPDVLRPAALVGAAVMPQAPAHGPDIDLEMGGEDRGVIHHGDACGLLQQPLPRRGIEDVHRGQHPLVEFRVGIAAAVDRAHPARRVPGAEGGAQPGGWLAGGGTPGDQESGEFLPAGAGDEGCIG